MPVVNRTSPQPLPPEGPAKLHIIETASGKSKEKKTPFLEMTFLDLKTNRKFKDRVYFADAATWKIDALCRSAGLILPSGPYRLTADDLEARVCYGSIVHETLQTGRTVAKMRSFWSKGYAIQQDESLEDIPDPPRVPPERELLELVENFDAPSGLPVAPPVAPEPPPPPSPVPPIPPPPPVRNVTLDQLEDLTAEEIAEVVAKIRAGKKDPKPPPS